MSNIDETPELCGENGCRKLTGHSGNHSATPNDAWNFFEDKDKKKLVKAGFATPRGGNKGAYQNHVSRNNKVIIPYEKLSDSNRENFKDGFIIRLYPEQYFEKKNTPKKMFKIKDAEIVVGENAFILYRTHESYKNLPPLETWTVRSLRKGKKKSSRRGKGILDRGHYVLRISSHGSNKGKNLGSPQGIFAPEYCSDEINFLSQAVLAWLTIHSANSPYTSVQGKHLQAILKKENLLDLVQYQDKDIIRNGLTICPLCLKYIKYEELHGTDSYEDSSVHDNAGEQVEGSTRSTIVNLFHLLPVNYRTLEHDPKKVAWGHAICNTKLGQRKCFTTKETQEMGLKVGIVMEDGIKTFGWITKNMEMIRSARGAVWILLNHDVPDDEWDLKI